MARLIIPRDKDIILSSIVTIIGNVPQPDKVLFVGDHSPLVVLVAHSPDAMHGIIIAAEFSLAPECCSQLIGSSSVYVLFYASAS
jgi:hypothetical protein